ncbi:LysR family transcriptional regulator [Maritimibacter dapengensis]|uniref:LysR family transcriptional regulator n=1 Tax=Maritimibacter dapengensis TaxID=2836868 RepID=A0ABS6T0Y7_9RHOB|nr:LysR family transcriptional regulator [Maritimibacter dapengensis]MBV7378660.1 LysR family transcriptional regulator [Maritimibacter dapengensis]
MARNLDLTALRAFVTVADTGGVTKAAGALHLTQSAVSMQLKRLEESLGRNLLDRSGRGIELTPEGDQLLSYARRMLELNDLALSRLTDRVFEGEITLGVPHDIVLPMMPPVLKAFNGLFPRMKVSLVSSFTKSLKEDFERGKIDIILTTEEEGEGAGEVLTSLPLLWMGADGGIAWKQRPLRLAFEARCKFRPRVQAVLDAQGIPWEMAVSSDEGRTIDASVGADLAVHARLAGTDMRPMYPIRHGGALPELPVYDVNLYVADTLKGAAVERLVSDLRTAYGAMSRTLRRAPAAE